MENGIPLKPYTSITSFSYVDETNVNIPQAVTKERTREREKGEESLKASSRRGKNFA